MKTGRFGKIDHIKKEDEIAILLNIFKYGYATETHLNITDRFIELEYDYTGGGLADEKDENSHPA